MIEKYCKTCSHKQVWSKMIEPQCTYYNNSLCKKCVKWCKGEHYMSTSKGLSIHSLSKWLEQLTKEEKELPIIVMKDNEKLLPYLMLKHITKNEDKWVIYCKDYDEENR